MSRINIRITAESEGLQTKAKAGNHQIVIDEPPASGGRDTGPNPLQYVLSALAGCENIVANMVAKEMNFDLQGLAFTIQGSLDLRGLRGEPDVRPYFDKVTIQATVRTGESEERVQELKEKTDLRCPVFTMLKAAGVELETTWAKG